MGTSVSCGSRAPTGSSNDAAAVPALAAASAMLSVVIPVLNEGSNIESAIDSVWVPELPRREQPEVVVVDGGSTDSTPQLAHRAGARVLRSASGRGTQLDTGWRASRGAWCLFLHADSRLPPDYLRALQPVLLAAKATEDEQGRAGATLPLQSATTQWACFRTIHTEWANTWNGRLLSAGVALRTRLLAMPYGDQGLLVSRAALQRVGGLPHWPFLEDVELVRRLKAAGHSRPLILPLPINTSGRRWDALGFWRTALLNQAVLAGWALGLPPQQLAAWYYSARRQT